MHNVASTLGCRFLLGALAFLFAGPFSHDLTQAQADQKKSGVKAPPPAPNKKPPAPVPHKDPPGKPAAASPKPHPDGPPHHADHAGAHHPHHADHTGPHQPHHADHAGPHHHHARALPKPHHHAHKHPPVLAAMRHLEQAYAILAEHANPLYGLHRISAMENIVAAYEHINLGIAGSTGRNVPETALLRGLPPGRDFHPIRMALGKVREAQDELKTLTANLRGQRTAAVIKLNFAVRDLDLALQHARTLSK